MYPFSVAINPQSLATQQQTSSTDGRGGHRIWRAVRPLDHLWLETAHWARGASSGHIGADGAVAMRLKPEAATRLGDSYTAYPKHLNVVTELWSALTHQLSSVQQPSSAALLPTQQTRVRCVAPSRSMDVGITLQPPVAALGEEPLEAVIAANKEASVHLKAYEPPASLFNWFGAASATAPSESAPNNLSTGRKASPADAELMWAAEKRQLLERIRQLEERNKSLGGDK